MVVNAALSIDRRVAVNLNYTVSQEVIQDCIDQAGIRHVLTSRKVMDKLGSEARHEPGHAGRSRGEADARPTSSPRSLGSYVVPARTADQVTGPEKVARATIC